MKKSILSISLVVLCITNVFAQKKALDHSVYDSWQSVGAASVTDDGSIVAYTINPQEGDAGLVLVNTLTGKELHIERGSVPSVSRDAKWAVLTIKAPFQATREAKIKKKKADEMPKDSVAYVNLSTFEITKLADASGLKASIEKNFVFAYQTGKKDSKSVVVIRPGNAPDTLKNADKYVFDRNGQRLAVVFKKNKKDSLSNNQVSLFKLSDMSASVLSEGKKFYGDPRFNESGDKLAFLASADSNDTGSKHCSLFLYEELTTGKGRKAVTTCHTEEIIPQDYTKGLAEGWGITDKSSPAFSKLSNRLFVNIDKYIPQNDTTLVDFETAKLDIWNYDIYLTPPMQKAGRSAGSCKGVINLKSDRNSVLALTTTTTERLSYIDGGEGEWAVASENGPYLIESTWGDRTYSDVSLVNLNTGARKTLFSKLPASPSVSPAGKYLTWYDEDESNWYSYRLADGNLVNLTKDVDGLFYDDEDDHPAPAPNVDRPHWLENDEYFIMADKYDIFKFQPDGKSVVNLTAGAGRANDVRYRYTTLTRSTVSPELSMMGVTQTIGRKEVVYLSAYDRTNKTNGFAKVSVEKPGLIQSWLKENSFAGMSKALNADLYLYRKGDFKHPMDVYTSTDFCASDKQLSHINPQQSQYRWGDVQLVHWDAFDGTHLDGLLYTPEDMDKSKKYPMMIYFYEKNSNTLYNYIAPAPSRSIINISFFVSRGYVVFVPDIVYVDGHPGESAYNCIVAGAESMCKQFSFIDRDKMAIQGQSWGGYQTAYLVTRTGLFAAAGAGAPVGNMTSAYGGIRWESGMVRAMQYEHGQSRIGKSLWDEGGLDLYIENSPIFHTQNVSTPVLIMHNDADGAVPWYQGIEYFMALRRFGHPAWLLEYNDEAHNLTQRKNCKDLSIRLSQFFDHYLKGEPMPAWMKTGVPNNRKGQYFGYEYAE